MVSYFRPQVPQGMGSVGITVMQAGYYARKPPALLQIIMGCGG